MKIMHMLPELEEGGVERLMPVYANEQTRLGHTVTVVSHGGRLVSLLGPGVRHIELPVHRKNPFVGISCARRLASLVRREEIDVVHAHSRVPAWIAYFVRKFAPRVRFVYTAHARFSSLNYGLWAIGQADGVICVSDSVRRHLRDWMPKRNPVRIIYNAPPGKVTPWRGGATDGAEKRLLFVGRVSDKKDPFTLVEALAALADRRWRLDVLGDGPAMPRLRERIAALGLEGRVHLHGFSNEVADMVANCDLFLFPSLDEEGLPLALIEVMASGAPVIASDISATRELAALPDGETGELLPVGDVDTWRSAIAGYLDGTYEPGLKLGVELPTPPEMVGQIVAFYEEILSRAN